VFEAGAKAAAEAMSDATTADFMVYVNGGGSSSSSSIYYYYLLLLKQSRIAKKRYNDHKARSMDDLFRLVRDERVEG
jgi:hypothetical protein